MKLHVLFASTLTVLLAAQPSFAGAAENWAGEYTDKNFLNGKAVFQVSIEQQAKSIQVSFDGAYTDAHGAAPEGQGPAKVNRKGTLEFTFEDNFKNSGTGTITRTGEEIVVSFQTNHVADARCLAFYGQNMHLKRVVKK